MQYDINKQTLKILVLSSGNIYNYEHLTSEIIFLSNQSIIIEQGKFAYSPLGKASENQTKQLKTNEKKQIKAIKDIFAKKFLGTDQKSIVCLFTKDFLNEETTYELKNYRNRK